MLPVLWFVLVLFQTNSVLCEVCDIADRDCTKSAINNYDSFVNGIDNIVDASDPLWIDEIVDKRPTITYKLTNASLSGMKDCVVNNMKVDREAKTLVYYLVCPHIVIKTNYEAKGTVITFNVEGNGVLTITADDYVFIFTCKYEKTIDEDGNVHVQITSHNYGVETRGRVAFKYTNLFNGDKAKSCCLAFNILYLTANMHNLHIISVFVFFGKMIVILCWIMYRLHPELFIIMTLWKQEQISECVQAFLPYLLLESNIKAHNADLAHRFINENWQTVAKIFRTPTIDRFVDLFIANLNKFLKYMSLQKLLPSKS